MKTTCHPRCEYYDENEGDCPHDMRECPSDPMVVAYEEWCENFPRHTNRINWAEKVIEWLKRKPKDPTSS